MVPLPRNLPSKDEKYKRKKIKEFYEFGFMEASGPDGNSFYMLSIYSVLKLNQKSFLTFTI